MLREGDLNQFIYYYNNIGDVPPEDPKEVLISENGLYPEEIIRLLKSMRIANLMGDISNHAFHVFERIVDQITGARTKNLQNKTEWCNAIAWAIAEVRNEQGRINSSTPSKRCIQVQQAGKRLRDQGYEVSVGAYGLALSDRSLIDITQRIDGLVSHLGGLEVIAQICRIFRDSNSIHDGMWLFGNQVPSMHVASSATLPAGWIFSMGLRHLGKSKKVRRPEVVWSSITSLATDAAATLDCQRYSQFEEIDIAPGNSWRVIRDSLIWREVFSLAQIPKQVIPSLKMALKELTMNGQCDLLGWRFEELFNEFEKLEDRIHYDRPTVHSRKFIKENYPNLYEAGIGIIGLVNKEYKFPTAGGSRNHHEFTFFECGKEGLLILPLPFLREAFCNKILQNIWKKLPPDAAKQLVGKIFETCLKNACLGKGGIVHSDCAYRVGKQNFQIDVATRDGDKIVLFEIKAKSLTAVARSGDMMAVYRDYTDSYLALILQLVRHESNIRKGITPLTLSNEEVTNFRPLKVAVSPLSYGPIADSVAASSLLRCFSGITLHSVLNDENGKKTLSDFNKTVQAIFKYVFDLAPQDKDRKLNLHAYFIDCFWYDLGQVLYALDRAYTVPDAFRALQHITFVTRDFWTEVAFADNQKITKGKWRPLLP